MSENERKNGTAFEQDIAKLFEAAGYEVSQTVGGQPGEVDWFAKSRTGLVRTTTYWQVWNTCPVVLDDALIALEETRTRKGADRALAVMNGSLPAGYAADLHGRPSNAITPRRLVVELFGFPDKVHAQKNQYESEHERTQFLPRKGRTSDGEIVDAVEFIKSWLATGDGDRLAIVAPPYSGRVSVIERAAYELSLEFESDPENADFLLLARSTSSARFEASMPDFHDGGTRKIRVSDVEDDNATGGSLNHDVALKLLAPTDSEIESWFEAQSLSREVIEQLRSARREVPEFKALSSAIPNLSPLLAAMRRPLSQTSRDTSDWMADVVSAYVDGLLSRTFNDLHSHVTDRKATRRLAGMVTTIEDAAFEQFALGRPAPSHSIADVRLNKSLDAALSTWLVRGTSEYTDVDGQDERQRVIGSFTNSLVLDYFVARKVAREIAAGNSAILSRYQLPREYVLLFLATLSPSAAAQATAERRAEIRAEIEVEVERRLQLTLAHQLKRSAGAVRASLRSLQKSIQKKMAPEDADAFRYDIGRIDEEAVFQSALAEQTRLWSEVPEGAIESLSLAEHVLTVVEPLRERYAGILCEVSIEPGIFVRANRSGIREILHGLIENAFHAAPFGNSDVPFVRVVAVSEGKSTRLDVIDSGPGIRPEDRDLVFEPYVTTKKGGDQPLGTGMGLVIARRYAQRVGARVEIATERQETCFFVRFVTGEEKV